MTSSKNEIQQRAKNDVGASFPNVLRADGDLRNHAFAIAQQEVQNVPGQDPLAVQDYAEQYIAAYRQAVEERDAQR
ncbi:hypothetical protein [Ktedonobacter robiniae]|uniref:Uncharacterized protein n=1 Tax=Ktedonobacter robiniae TaxID=2778365 RepID=A0ABQ3UVH0_9CHLR|nr:hypothetical protein [Ktedonobacter robiniae]GHO56801.1 hypothetical protein KSB_52760 [Ktedonobacter robiniae]